MSVALEYSFMLSQLCAHFQYPVGRVESQSDLETWAPSMYVSGRRLASLHGCQPLLVSS